MLKRKLKKLQKDETGQSFVELALILPILILLLTLPVDFFRYINTKMILSSAASEAIGELNYATANASDAETKILDKVDEYYGKRLDGTVEVKAYGVYDISTPIDYIYKLYSSDKANPDNYDSQFEKRDSNYQIAEVRLQLSVKMAPITFWGVLFFTSSFDVKTPLYTRDVYAGGYKPGP